MITAIYLQTRFLKIEKSCGNTLGRILRRLFKKEERKISTPTKKPEKAMKLRHPMNTE